MSEHSNCRGRDPARENTKVSFGVQMMLSLVLLLRQRMAVNASLNPIGRAAGNPFASQTTKAIMQLWTQLVMACELCGIEPPTLRSVMQSLNQKNACTKAPDAEHDDNSASKALAMSLMSAWLETSMKCTSSGIPAPTFEHFLGGCFSASDLWPRHRGKNGLAVIDYQPTIV